MQCQTGLSAPSPFLGGLHREEQKYAGHAHIVHESPDIQDMGVDDGIKYIGQDDFLQDVFQPMLQKALVYQIGPDKPGSPQYFQSKGQGDVARKAVQDEAYKTPENQKPGQGAIGSGGQEI